MAAAPAISVIIPALNEAPLIGATLASVLAGEPAQVIVVDGGSEDETVGIARDAGAEVLTSEAGRGRQMNRGALHARGDVLLFLHADATLPDEYPRHIATALSLPGVAAGAFRLRIGAPAPGMGLRLIEKMVTLRSRWLGLPFGDQGLFLTADMFARTGGFADWPIMEDFEFVRRLRRHGRIALAGACVTTSARRWQRLGVLRATLNHQLIIAAYLAGKSPHRLVRWRR